MKHITEEIVVGMQTYTAIISYDHSKHRNAPITIYINQKDNKILDDYVYTIADSSTYLHRARTDDQLKSLNQYFVKKFKVPVYLSVSGDAEYSNVEMFRSIVDLIEPTYT